MVVHGAIPVAKLGALLVRQLSKPFVNIFVANAKNHPYFRKYVCLPPAHLYNWLEVRTKNMLLNMGHKSVVINVLNEDKSVELGATLICESLMYLIAALLVIQEYNKGVVKEAAKEEKKKQEFQDIKDKVVLLMSRGEEQSKLLQDLLSRLANLENSITGIKPSNPVIITEEPPDSQDFVLIPEDDEGESDPVED